MVTLLSTAGVQTPGLTLIPLGERRILVRAVPLGAPRKVDKEGGRLKNPEGRSDEANRPSRTVFPKMYSSKEQSAHCRALKKDPGRGQRTKSDSMIKRSVTIPNLFSPYDILKLYSSNSRDPLITPGIQSLVNQPLLNPHS